MSFRTFGLATVTGLALLSSVTAIATPAIAHGQYDRDWNRSERSEQYRHDRWGWYDSYGHYHRYDRDGNSHRSY